MTSASHRRLEPRDLARIAVFAAIIAVLGLPGQIPVPGLVPITLQSLGVMLAGAVFGPWRGAIAVLVFEILVFAGLPLLAGGFGGAAVFVGPTAGYLLGWIFGAAAVGAIVQARATIAWPRTLLATLVGGILVIYAFGIPVTSVVTGAPIGPTAVAALVFIPGDLLKVAIATLVTQTLVRAYPAAFPERHRRTTSVAAVRHV